MQDAGLRLDVFLADRLALSRAQARRLLERGAVRVDGRCVAVRAKGLAVSPGSWIEVEGFRRPEEQRALPEPERPCTLLASGEGWIAVDKPAGVPVHPLAEAERGSVLNAVAARFPAIHGVGEAGLRSGVVHRLDVDTSGVLLLALAEPTWGRLRAAFREHRVLKCYRAIVTGAVERPGRVALPLVMARHRPARVRVLGPGEVSRGARRAELSYRPLERLRGATLLEVAPRTGHLHQIRVTLAHLGFPVAGDPTYGVAGALGAPRQMLHAARVEHEELRAESPDPPDFAAQLAALRS